MSSAGTKQNRLATPAYRRVFGSFYEDAEGRFYVLQFPFGAPDVGEDGQPTAEVYYPCPRLDSASFRVLSDVYCSDKNGVYLNWLSHYNGSFAKIPNADPATFQVYSCLPIAGYDKQRVFYCGQPVMGLVSTGTKLYTPAGSCYSDVPEWNLDAAEWCLSDGQKTFCNTNSARTAKTARLAANYRAAKQLLRSE